MSNNNDETTEPIEGFTYYNINEYEFVQNINRSKSFIYLYQHPFTKQTVAVKELKIYNQNLTKNQLDMKMRILKRLHDLKHPNIVLYKGVAKLVKKYADRSTESLLIFMEFCEMDLFQYACERHARKEFLTVNEIKDFLEQTLIALELLENWGIAHRDIKPQNILIQAGKYKLCDFQDAIHCIGQLNDIPINITTPSYSPFSLVLELKNRRQKAYDPFKADVYSLGITLLVLISLGAFSPNERIYYQTTRDHSAFMKQMRKKYVKRYESGNLNRVVKLMLEDDEYKRENFVTLRMKIAKLNNICTYDQNRSENSSTTEDTSKKGSSNEVRLRMTERVEIGNNKAVIGGIGMGFFFIFALLCIF